MSSAPVVGIGAGPSKACLRISILQKSPKQLREDNRGSKKANAPS